MSTPLARRTALTLVTGGPAAQREAAVAARLAHAGPPRGLVAVVLEGLPSGQTLLSPSDSLHVYRIAPGCLCCTGNLVLRVTLNRILRLRPELLFIGLAATDHLDQLRSWLQEPPYDQLLELTADLRT
ncbi:GTPase [Massilia genomosp. 1]|uniref:GTPase n=1 Tax=Massilia genomosp. 1 TaxID=2609280 RepID=A0ABX0MND5_9BURK|nr:GTPase [Massilia genomosp. 1]NHZ60889.1 GTPase [Massilia genomosp. 1]